MDPIKRQGLEASGWAVGDSSDFLELTPEEEAAIEAAIQAMFITTTHVGVKHSPIEGDPLRIEITVGIEGLGAD